MAGMARAAIGVHGEEVGCLEVRALSMDLVVGKHEEFLVNSILSNSTSFCTRRM